MTNHYVATVPVKFTDTDGQERTRFQRVGAMFRNTTRGTRKSSASSATSRPLASCPADDVREVRTIPIPYRCGWAAL